MTEIYPILDSATAAQYSYYTVDIVTNKILAEIPFEDVNYERTLKGSGSFDGKIAINTQTKDLDLYNSTLPGKCALYVVRDGVCMWGGIIWGRTYDLFSRSLNVTGSEFTSYLKHRVIWKTYSYQFTATVQKSAKKSPARVTLQNTGNVNLKIPIKVLDDYGNLNSVYVSFTRSDLIQYNNYYTLSASETPTTNTFAINIPNIPVGTHTDVSVSVRVDTYEYLKELMKEAAQDFVDTQFANETITPGIKIPYEITNKVASGGVVTLTTSGTHDLVVGQNIEIRNVDENVDGYRVVSEVPSSTSLRVVVPAYNVATVSASANTATITVDVTDTGDIFKLAKGSRVTITGVPTFGGYNYFNFSNVEILSVSNNNTFTYAITNPLGSTAITNISNVSSYIEYTAANTFSAGQYVTVQNANIAKYNQNNALITYADGAKFRVYNPYGPFSSGFVSTGAVAYIGVPTSSGTPGVVSQVSIASTNIYTNKYEVSTRSLKPTKPYGVESASRVKNSDKTVFIVTLQLSKTSTRAFPFQKGDTITMTLNGDKKDSNGEFTFTSLTNGDGGGTVLSAVDKKNKTVSYELTGISTTNKSDEYIGDITGFALGTSDNFINYANLLTEIELGLNELTSFRKDQYVYVTGVDGASWGQPVYNGYHKITSITPAGNITTSVTHYESSAGIAKIYTAKNNSFDNNDEVTVAGFTGGLTTLNGAIRVLDSVQGSLDGQSYFTYFIDDNTTRAKTLVSGVTAKVKGSNKIRYDLPEYNPMGEPDSTFNAIKYKVVGYASTSSDKRSKVIIQTQEIISIKAGDSVNVAIGDNTTDGSYKIDTVGSTGYTFTYTIPENKSAVKKSGDDTFKNCTGVVSRYMAQLDQQSLTYNPVISGLSCEQNLVTVYSNNHQYSPDDLVTLKSFPTAFQHYDNNGFKARVQNVDTDYFSYTLTNFRDGTTSAPTAGVAQITKYKFTKNAKNTTSGTIRFTTIRDHFYTVGSKVLVSGIPKSQTGTAFLQRITWSNVFTVSAVSTPGATVKYFDVEITGLTSAATTAEFTSLTNTIPTAGNSSPAGTTNITLVTGSAHGIAVDKTVTVSGVTPEAYNGTWKTQAGTTGSTIVLNIGTNPGAVTVAGNVSLGKAVSTAQIVVASKALTSGSATATTLTYVGTSLPFTSGQKVTIVGFTGTGATRLNASGTVNASSTSTSLVVSLAGATASSSSSGVPFAYATAAIAPKASIDYSQSISAQEVFGFSAVASTQVVTLYAPSHGFSNQDLVKLSGVSSTYVPKNSEPALITKIDDDTFSYVAANPASPSFASDVSVSGSITAITFPTSGTVRFAATNSFSVGDRLVIKDVLPDVYNLYNVVVTGRTGSYFEISNPETSAYVSSNGMAMKALVPTGTAINAPYVSLTPVAFSRSYGEFPNNTSIGGLDFDGTTYSGNFYPNTIVRGSDMITLDAHMEQYSNSVNGFNYRIDCTLESVGGTSTFKRKFVLVPLTPPTLKEYLNTLPGGVLGRGDVAPPSAFGADKITFEHPGNVRNVNLSESAENSATRMFISGNNGAGDPNSVARFSGAAETDLLDAGWPILDKAEKIDWPTQYNPLTVTVNRDNWGNYDAEQDFHATAQRFLYQSRPPQGDFIIRVNGSLSPVIGTYNPGDWCQLIVDDESGFINSRLASALEPRKDVILRRIDNIKVSVPNSPTFPEDIDLTLVTDWEVDRIGK